MNVKELWAYADAKRHLRMIRENLYEFESNIYSPPGANTSGMPIEHGTENNDKLAAVIEKHQVLLAAEYNAVLKAVDAYDLLERFANTLSNDEQDVLYARYREGLTIRNMEQKLRRSESTLNRTLKRVKRKFESFES